MLYKVRKPWIQKRDEWPHREDLWAAPPEQMVNERLKGKETHLKQRKLNKGQSTIKNSVFLHSLILLQKQFYTQGKKNSSRRYTIKTKNLWQLLTLIHGFIQTHIMTSLFPPVLLFSYNRFWQGMDLSRNTYRCASIYYEYKKYPPLIPCHIQVYV